ncbi:MAG: hypothetical protein MJ229_05010, partial [bacterium]|nr:hypothetical protein [bacterium]
MKNKIYLFIIIVVTLMCHVPAFAYEETDGNIFSYKFFSTGEYVPISPDTSPDPMYSTGYVNQQSREALYGAEKYWADILKLPENTQKASYNILRYEDAN